MNKEQTARKRLEKLMNKSKPLDHLSKSSKALENDVSEHEPNQAKETRDFEKLEQTAGKRLAQGANRPKETGEFKNKEETKRKKL